MVSDTQKETSESQSQIEYKWPELDRHELAKYYNEIKANKVVHFYDSSCYLCLTIHTILF